MPQVRLDGLGAVTMSPGTYSKTCLPKDTGGSLPLAAPRYAVRFSARGDNVPIGKFNPDFHRCGDRPFHLYTFRRSSFRSPDRPRKGVTVPCAPKISKATAPIFEHCGRLGLKGIVSKRADSRYRAGRSKA